MGSTGVAGPSPRYVGVGPRAVAVIIDFVILFAIGWGIAAVTGNTTAGGFEMEGAPAFLMFGLWLVYLIGSEAVVGATIGKLLVGIKVVMEDGAPIDLGAAVVRNVLRIVDGLFVYLVGAILVWRSPTRQRVGDRAANTVVVYRRKARDLATT